MLKTVLNDRRVQLFAGLTVLTVLVSRVTLPPILAFGLVIHSGYWIMLGLVALFIRALVRDLRKDGRPSVPGRFDAAVAVLVLVTVAIWIVHDRPGYKVLADELLLSGTAMGMHYERDAAYPIRATDVQGSFQVLANVLDKRPLLFPFLTASVHDLTGYRPQNPFYLNMALGVGFLWLAYLAGRAIGGSSWAGVLMLLLFAGLPLLAQQASGGGFELLNLLLIVGFGILLMRYLERPESVARLEALVFAGLLLASSRYESVLFLAVGAAGVMAGWYRAGKVVMSWPVILAPVFLLPVLIQNRIFSGESQAWEMASIGASQPFGFNYLAPNLGHALAFFFDFSGYQPNSPVFAALGLLCLPFFGIWILRVLRARDASSPTELAWALVGLGLFGITTVYLFYFWGQFDHPVIRRLSLPVHLLMAIAIIVSASRLVRSVRGWQLAAAIVLAGIFVHSLPVMARQAYRSLYSPGVEMEIRQDFLAGLADPNILFIDNDTVFWITRKVPASPIRQAMDRKDGLIYHLRNHSFQAMYVFQSILVDDRTGERSIDPADDLGPDFELETVLEERVQTLLLARISRVIEIRDRGKTAAQAAPFVALSQETRSAEQLDEARSKYLENWIKQLP